MLRGTEVESKSSVVGNRGPYLNSDEIVVFCSCNRLYSPYVPMVPLPWGKEVSAPNRREKRKMIPPFFTPPPLFLFRYNYEVIFPRYTSRKNRNPPPPPLGGIFARRAKWACAMRARCSLLSPPPPPPPPTLFFVKATLYPACCRKDKKEKRFLHFCAFFSHPPLCEWRAGFWWKNDIYIRKYPLSLCIFAKTSRI